VIGIRSVKRLRSLIGVKVGFYMDKALKRRLRGLRPLRREIGTSLNRTEIIGG